VGGVVGFQGLFPPSTTLFFPNTKYVCRDEVVVVVEEGEGLDFIMLVFCKPFKKKKPLGSFSLLAPPFFKTSFSPLCCSD